MTDAFILTALCMPSSLAFFSETKTAAAAPSTFIPALPSANCAKNEDSARFAGSPVPSPPCCISVTSCPRSSFKSLPADNIFPSPIPLCAAPKAEKNAEERIKQLKDQALKDIKDDFVANFDMEKLKNSLNSVLEPHPSIAIEINVFPDINILSEVGPK